MIPIYNRYSYHTPYKNNFRSQNKVDDRNILPFLVGAAIGLPIGFIASNNKNYYPYPAYPQQVPYQMPYPYPQQIPYQMPYPMQYY